MKKTLLLITIITAITFSSCKKDDDTTTTTTTTSTTSGGASDTPSGELEKCYQYNYKHDGEDLEYQAVGCFTEAEKTEGERWEGKYNFIKKNACGNCD